MSKFHVSVLLQEVIDSLNVKPGELYIDATLGGGGHSLEILKRGGKVLGIDLDAKSLEQVEKEIEETSFEVGKDLILAQGNFKDIEKIAKENGFEKVAGIIFDLGVSSYQIDTASRGFSFQEDGPLDMRMSKDLGVTAADLVNGLNKGELYELFTKLGEEHNARTISNNIISAREIKKIETTSELVEIVAKSFGLYGEVKPFMKARTSQKVFQALRIAVNDELNNLKETLPAAINLLEKGGRLAVISFHSLEDRIVKWEFIEKEKAGFGIVITKHPILPLPAEITENRRSSSAKLRVFEKN